jgi:arsenite methyltransferase
MKRGKLNMKPWLILMLTAIALFFLIQCSSTHSQEGFNRLASDPKWKPDQTLDTLQIQKGWHIGDLGAGGGYYTFRFAEATGASGNVYAADINMEFLVGIAAEADKRGLNKIDTILSTENDSRFPEQALDLIFIRNTFHHIEKKGEYLRKLIPKLRAGGRIVIIDYKENASFWLFGHNVSRDEILNAAFEAGLQVKNEYDFLDSQYFIVLARE